MCVDLNKIKAMMYFNLKMRKSTGCKSSTEKKEKRK